MPNLFREEAEARAATVSDLDYAIALDLTTGDEQFGCETTIRFAGSHARSTFLDYEAPSVESISLNGEPLDPAEVFAGERIELASIADQNELIIRSASAYQHNGTGLHFFRDPVDDQIYLHTQFEPWDAHKMFPCFDQPDLKATFTFEVLGDPAWEVVSNTPAMTSAGGKTRFATTPRLPPYLTAIVAGPYSSVFDGYRDIPLGIYCRQSLADHLDPDEIFEITKQGFEYYERTFEYPYAFGKYDQLFVPEFNFGAMENAGCVTFTESYIFRSRVTEARRERRATTILHELAHMWFGDVVTMRWWDDLWLNESFAEFMATLALVESTRFKNGWVTFADDTKTSARHQDQLPTTHPVATDAPSVESMLLNFDGITYEKGASALRQLVAWVGEKTFLDCLGPYFCQFEFENATLADFLGALERGSGRDLKQWMREWLQTTGVNTVTAAATEAGGKYESFTIEQSAHAEHPTLRSHRLAIGLYDRRGAHEGDGDDTKLTRRDSIELDIRGPITEVADLVGEPAAALVLVNDRDLSFVRTTFDEKSLAVITSTLAGLDDALARALCWSSLWDMVRDAELAPSRFVDIVMRNIHGESDIGVIERLLTGAQSALTLYTDPGRRTEHTPRWRAHARESLTAATPGSDLQLAWARTYASVASPTEGNDLHALLDGAWEIAGLAVDTDLRWHLVTSLAALGAGPADLIDAEHERDPTDEGARRATTARSARPEPEAKSHAWSLAVEDNGASLATRRAAMTGLHRFGQEDLLEQWVAPYFAALPGIWERFDSEDALDIAGGLFPRTAVSDGLLSQCAHALESGLPAPFVRIIREQADTVRRALAARAL